VLTAARVRKAEKALGFKLPAAYLALLAERNGAYLRCGQFPTTKCPSWAADHVLFDHVIGIGGEDGVDAEFGSKYLIAEWGYPDTGVVISTDGHTAFMLDYSRCGPKGEPRVVWIDVEAGEKPRAVVLAPNFAAFLKKLREDEE